MAAKAMFSTSTTAPQPTKCWIPSEHRELFANIIEKKPFFIVNPGLIDRPDVRGDQIEIGNRYFEGAASGTIMVGERPNNGEFDKLFDWPDSLIDLPYNSSTIDAVLDRAGFRTWQARRVAVDECSTISIEA